MQLVHSPRCLMDIGYPASVDAVRPFSTRHVAAAQGVTAVCLLRAAAVLDAALETI